MRYLINKNTADLILNTANELKQAQIFEGSTQRPFSVQIIENINLSTARLETDPLKIGFPFKSFYCSEATDTSVSISMISPFRAAAYITLLPLHVMRYIRPSKHTKTTPVLHLLSSASMLAPASINNCKHARLTKSICDS